MPNRIGAVPIICPIIGTTINLITNNSGELEIYNIGSGDTGNMAMKIVHNNGLGYASEGKDILDNLWSDPYPPDPNPNHTSWLRPSSIIYDAAEYELQTDFRPDNSTSSVNITLKVIHDEAGAKQISCSNHLKLEFGSIQGAYPNFGSKPITLWRRNIIDPNNNPNDPNNYTISFMADIREVIAKNGGIIPLPNLDGEYQSQVPYDFLQVRFDVYPGDFDFELDASGKIINGVVDMKDLPYLGEDWGKQGEPKEFVGDITGPQGLPDGNVDYQDLELLTRYWLKDIRDIMPSP